MTCRINIQFAVQKSLAPSSYLLRKWAKQAVPKKIKKTEVTIRIVGIPEMSELNAAYRHKQGPTNVLSFAYEAKDYLGDIVICADVVKREAREQGKPAKLHWAHMVVHGIYHLLGYDHETDAEATEMETREIKTMRVLGFPNPYELRKL